MGLGVSGQVFLYKDKNLYYVVKRHHGREKYESRSEYKKRVLYEYHILREISNEYFVRAIKYKISLDGNTIRVYLEAGDRDLGKLLKLRSNPLGAKEAMCLWKQICLGVRYLHSVGYSHRDLKLENVVLSRESTIIKIIDLVTASPTNRPAFGLVGSVHYVAPEQVSQLSYEGKAADIWSLATILYVLVLKKFPWTLAQMSDSVFSRYRNECMGINEKDSSDYGFENLSDIIGTNIIFKLFQVDPEKRPTIEQIVQDPWFSAVCHCSRSGLCGIPHEIRQKECIT